MAGPFEHCCQNGGTQLTDVLPHFVGYLEKAKSVAALLATSQSIRDACKHALAGNIDAGSTLLLGVLDTHLSRVFAVLEFNQRLEQLARWNPKYPYESKCRQVDSTVWKTEISCLLDICGDTVLQSSSFTARMVAICALHIERSCDRRDMTDAAAEVLSCLLAAGCRAPYSQLLEAHRSEHHHKGYAAWMTAHSKHSMTLAFNDEDFVPYDLPNDHHNQQAVTAALTAIQATDVEALEHQLDVLGSPPLLILDLIAIVGKLAPHADSVNKYLSDRVPQIVNSDELVEMMLQGLRNGCPVLRKLMDTAASMRLPATSQQLNLLLRSIFSFPTEICWLLNESPAFDGPYDSPLFTPCSEGAIAEVIQACDSSSYPHGNVLQKFNQDWQHSVKRYILDTVCSVMSRSQGHLVVSNATIEEMLADVIRGLHNYMHKCGVTFDLKLLLSEWCGLAEYELRVGYVHHCIKLITCLCSLTTANDLLAKGSHDLLMQLLTAVAAPGSSSAFLPAFKLVLKLAQGKHSIAPELAARIYARATATQLDRGSVSVAMAVVVLELPVLQRVHEQLLVTSEIQVLVSHDSVDAEVLANAVANSVMDSASDATADPAAESTSDATMASNIHSLTDLAVESALHVTADPAAESTSDDIMASDDHSLTDWAVEPALQVTGASAAGSTSDATMASDDHSLADWAVESALHVTGASAAGSTSDATTDAAAGDAVDSESDFVSICSDDWFDCEDTLGVL